MNTKTKPKHTHEFSRSKPTASVETCSCGKFRHTEHSGAPIEGQTTQPHTPTPWKVKFVGQSYKAFGGSIEGADGNQVALITVPRSGSDEERHANANFVIHACNNIERITAERDAWEKRSAQYEQITRDLQTSRAELLTACKAGMTFMSDLSFIVSFIDNPKATHAWDACRNAIQSAEKARGK